MNAAAPLPTDATSRPAPELSVIVPVFDHPAAIAPLVERLRAALSGRDWEVVFVDDNAPDAVRAAIAAIGDPRVRTLRRVGRSGLTQTCLVAMLASQSPFVAMLDPAGFDASVLTAMLERLARNEADIAAASRERPAGSAPRKLGRKILSTITRRTLATDIGDPTSSFFMIRREALEQVAPSLSSLGYQVLLDVVATARGRLRVVELPGAHDAAANRSELKLALELLALMIAKFSNDAVSIRFMLFCLVGLSGVGAHLAFLYAALLLMPFTYAQTAATIGAMAWNFTLNNTITYGDQRLSGWAYISGMLRFMVVCGIGAVSNVGVASWIYAHDNVWWIAGLGGAVMGAVWNYAVSSVFVWRPR